MPVEAGGSLATEYIFEANTLWVKFFIDLASAYY